MHRPIYLSAAIGVQNVGNHWTRHFSVVCLFAAANGALFVQKKLGFRAGLQNIGLKKKVF